METTDTVQEIRRARGRGRGRRHGVALGAMLATSAFVGSCACTPTPRAPTPPTTTAGPTTTAPTGGIVRTVTDASFEWTISKETNNATFAPGQVNYWSAGESDSTESKYVPTNGNVTVLKKNASGTYVPIGSEPAVSWANKNRDATGPTPAGSPAGAVGTVVTVSNAYFLNQKVRYTGGTGTVDTATGAATVQWTGTFSINFYGSYVPFWIKDPKLTVTAGGVGKITATVAGFASSLEDPDTRVSLPAANVTIADLPVVAGANTTGFTAATAYLGNVVTTPPTAPQVAKTTGAGGNSAYWGAWPQSFVDFQLATGLGAYWYTSGLLSTDPQKVQDPVTVAYQLAP